MPDDIRFVVEKSFRSDAATARELHDEMVDRHSVARVAIELRERKDVANRGSFYEQVGVVDDVVDEVIEAVMNRGGRVAIVADGSMAERGRIALKLRF